MAKLVYKSFDSLANFLSPTFSERATLVSPVLKARRARRALCRRQEAGPEATEADCFDYRYILKDISNDIMTI